MNKEGVIIMGDEVLFSAAKGAETDKRQSIATILAIVAIDPSKNGENARNPMLWTTLEKRSKPETEKFAGQISLPAETRKLGENKLSNMLGALPEFSENSDLIRELIFMQSPTSYIEGRISVSNSPVDLAVLLVNGFPTAPIVPLDANEVAANGWMSMNEIEALHQTNPSRLRGFMGQVIAMERADMVIHRVVEDYFQHPEKRFPLSERLPSNFSMLDFYNQREMTADVVGAKPNK